MAIFTPSSSNSVAAAAHDSTTVIGRTIAKEETRPDSTSCLLSSPRLHESGAHEHETVLLLDGGAHPAAPAAPLLLGCSAEEEERGRGEAGERSAAAMAALSPVAGLTLVEEEQRSTRESFASATRKRYPDSTARLRAYSTETQ